MIVRPAAPSDLAACLAVDVQYRTDQVWQMRVQQGDFLGEGEEGLFVTFRPMRLPRPVILASPSLQKRLEAEWQHRDLLLVLEDEDAICGYLGLKVYAGQGLGWVDLLTVAPEKQGQGWHRRLLEAAINWGKNRQLRALTVETQARNAPIIALVRQLGFRFSGYNEHFYEEAEVALFFTLLL